MYSNELKALKKANRFRERKLFSDDLYDFASNDYLGLAYNKKQFNKAVKVVKKYDTLTSKASMLVNGYHPIHYKFERLLSKYNGFEDAVVVGSGFLANMSLIEALVRKGDRLFIDEEYHASGMIASQLLGDRVTLFRHNDIDDLRDKLIANPAKRQIVAVEGIYSMSGELCKKEIFDVVDEFQTLLIVDEAHSAGVIGKKLLGIFEYYNITINNRHIKMGTLGKAYGSYGAYILASNTIVSFLLNRAKPIIYSTAPSIFDTALAMVNLKYIQKNAKEYRKKIKVREKLVKNILHIKIKSLILPIEIDSNKSVMVMQKYLIDYKYLVGAIRQPTVDKPILRVILNLSIPLERVKKLLRLISDKTV